jgi:hypothetical protein
VESQVWVDKSANKSQMNSLISVRYVFPY